MIPVLVVAQVVAEMAPQLVGDAASLSTLFRNAASAVESAQTSPSGEVSASAWSALDQQVKALQSKLADEAAKA